MPPEVDPNLDDRSAVRPTVVAVCRVVAPAGAQSKVEGIRMQKGRIEAYQTVWIVKLGEVVRRLQLCWSISGISTADMNQSVGHGSTSRIFTNQVRLVEKRMNASTGGIEVGSC